jgi:hypothetical protein
MYGGVISYLRFLGNVAACLVLPPGIGVVLVFFIAASCVSSVCILYLQCCTLTDALVLSWHCSSLLHCYCVMCAVGFIGFHFLLLSWGLESFSIPSGLLVGVVFSGWPWISCWEELCGCLGRLLCVCKTSPGCLSVGPFSDVLGFTWWCPWTPPCKS